MKTLNIIAASAAALLMMGAVSCEREMPEEITELVLPKCLTPTSLSTVIENDFDVLFDWKTMKDADSYNLVVATDAECTQIIESVTVPKSQVPYKLTLEPGTYYYKVQASAEDRDPSKWVYCTKSVTVKKPVVTVDISLAGTANCYIVSEEGKYKFKTTKGATEESVGEVASVAVVWETSVETTGKALDVKSIVDQVKLLEGGYIEFTTATPFKAGNALLAAKDGSGKILWSWHIWVVSEPVADVDLGNGIVLMDRNIGELTTMADGATSMLYQWGRKDPFPGTNGNKGVLSVAGTEITYLSTTKSVSDAAATPTVLYGVLSTSSAGAQPYGLKDGDTDFWGKTKTMYDPCPVGYKVPIASSSAPTANDLSTTRFAFLSAMTFADCFLYTADNGNVLKVRPAGFRWLNTDTAHYSEAALQVRNEGNSCMLWTASRVNKRLAGTVRLAKDGGVSFYAKGGDNAATYHGKNNAYAIRCEKVTE